MVVCKCRKATKLYCFVHKVPVCGECICFPEHQICVIRTYSDWVIDGEYDWPPTCCFCNAALEDGVDLQTTRLGCIHLMHTNCLVSHIQSFPPQTPPTGYTCPTCTSPIWPPKSIKDTGSCLHSKLKEAINKSGLGKNLFGNHLVTLPPADFHAPPPAFATDPIAHLSTIEKKEVGGAISLNSTADLSLPSSSVVKEEYTDEAYKSLIGTNTSVLSEPDIVEIEGPTSVKSLSPAGPGPSATTRKATSHIDRQNLEFAYYADDEDGSRKKYNRRGSFRHKFLRLLLPFWSSTLPTLPVTAPPRRDGSNGDDVQEGRLRHQRSSKMDPRKILLTMAIMACMATMGILYYRLAQRSLGESVLEDERQ